MLCKLRVPLSRQSWQINAEHLSYICLHSNLQENWTIHILGRSLSYFYLEFTIIYLQRCSSSFLFNRSLIFSISSMELFSYHVSVAQVSINPFLNFLYLIFLVSFPQNHYTNYICYLIIKANNLQADNLYLTIMSTIMEQTIQKKPNFKKTPSHAHQWFKMMNLNKRFTDIVVW